MYIYIKIGSVICLALAQPPYPLNFGLDLLINATLLHSQIAIIVLSILFSNFIIMPRSSSLSPSSLSDILTDIDPSGLESSAVTNSNPPLPPTNAFTALALIPSRKRALVYVEVERDPKRVRTSAIWAHGREVQLENSTNGQRFWECNLCHIRLTASATTNAGTHLRRIHMIKMNSPALLALTVMDQQLQGVEQQQLNNTSLS
jgi:BED zinc finger